MTRFLRQPPWCGLLAILRFLNKSKNFLFLIFCFIWSNSGNAELVSGHDRQRLALIFLHQLEVYFKNTPVQINTAQFPVEITKDSANENRFNLYQVLAEEGWLSVTAASRPVTADGDEVSYKQVFTFSIHPDRIDQHYIPAAQIKVSQITALKLTIVDDITFYQVDFNWQSSELAPWFWAKSLEQLKLASILKDSLLIEQQAQAEFYWNATQWELTQAPQLFTP